jgi:hypothetical protein
MKLSKIEYLNKGYADTLQLHDAKQEKENLRHMLIITHKQNYTFPDGSIFNAEEAKNRIKELTYHIIPQLYKEMTETRYTNLTNLIRI